MCLFMQKALSADARGHVCGAALVPRSSAAPAASADEDGRLPPVRSVCGTPADEAWLPIASSADVRMSLSVGEAGGARAPAPLRPAATGGQIITTSTQSWPCLHGWVLASGAKRRSVPRPF